MRDFLGRVAKSCRAFRGLFAIVGNTVRVCAGYLAVGRYDKLFLIMQSGRRGEACRLNTAQSTPVARSGLNGHYA